MQITIETITPEIAASMLAKNRSNRNLNTKHVNFISAQITNGYFRLTGDTIKISKEGVLIDGQHRLTAIVHANIPVSCAVARDVEMEAFEVIDTGKVRGAADVVAISGYNYANSRAAIARHIITYDAGNDVKMAKGSKNGTADPDAVSNKKILDFVEKTDLNPCIDFANLVLRRILERNLLSNAKITGRVKRYYIIRAWNAYRDKASITKIPYDSTYKMPEIK